MKNDVYRELLTDDMRRGDMSQSATRETSADRIGALATADGLGAALWRTLATMEPAAFIKARTILVERLQAQHTKLPGALLKLIAQRCMEEWMAVGNPRGLLHDDRIKAMSMSPKMYAGLKQVFGDAHKIIRSADRGVGRSLSKKLEHS
jgi:hypothetical protein